MTFTRPYPKPVRVKREEKRPAVKEAVPLECIEQETVAQWLDLHNVFYCASVAGAYLHPATFIRMKKIGYKKGAPDLMIYQKPPAYNGQFVGVAIEMKRKKGGVVSDEQREWLEKLRAQGWMAVVCAGADAAIEILEMCGYGKK